MLKGLPANDAWPGILLARQDRKRFIGKLRRLTEPSLHVGIRLCGHSAGDSLCLWGIRDLLAAEILGWSAGAVQVAEEVDARVVDGLLNKLAGTLVAPEGCPEGSRAVSAVVLAHDLADRCSGFFSVVEGDGGDEVVQNVGADDVVEEVGVDKSEVTIDGGSGTTGEVPGAIVIVREGTVSVLKEGDGN